MVSTLIDVNGFVFSSLSQESSRVTQDSGVCMNAVTTYRRKKGDKSPVDQMTKWYGIIKQILEVDYTNREIVEFVFHCDWVKVESGCKICPDSNLVVVNLDRIRSVDRYFDEPAILACEASQVFYSKDLKYPDWWAVIHSQRKMTRKVDNISKPKSEEFQEIFSDEPHLEDLLKLCR